MNDFVSRILSEVETYHAKIVAVDQQQGQYVNDHQEGRIDDRRLIELQAPASAEKNRIIHEFEESILPILNEAKERGMETKTSSALASLAIGTDARSEFARDALRERSEA